MTPIEECRHCGEEITDMDIAVEDTDWGGHGTGEFFCNDDCHSNAAEAYGVAHAADMYNS